MNYTYTVTDKQKDPTNGNIYVNVVFDDGAGNTYIRPTWAFDLTDDSIDTWARNVINTFETRDANFAAITTGVAKTPKPIDPSVQAIADAQTALQQAIADANLAKLAAESPEVADALAAVTSAKALSVSDSKVVS